MTIAVRARGRRPTAAPGRVPGRSADGPAPRGAARVPAGLLGLALLTGCATASPGLVPGTGADDPGVPADPTAYAAALVSGTNRARAAEGLPPLDPDTCAADAATARARALVGTPGLEHAPMDDVLAACRPSSRAAENLGRAAAAPDDVVTAWLGSPGHRENLLSESLTELGVGCVPDGGAMLCSQVFLGP